MNTKREKTSHARDEKTPPNIFTDHDWFRHNEKALLDQYGECCVAVYNEKVIGVGDTYQAAIDDAELHLPPNVGQVTPIIEFLHHRHPFFRVRPVDFPAKAKD
jgi:hypothetical protein